MRRRVERLSLDALMMGLVIGICAILLERWFGAAAWLVRMIALVVVGLFLCALQYGLMRWMRR